MNRRIRFSGEKKLPYPMKNYFFALSYEKPLLNAISYEKLLYYVVSYEKPFYNINCVNSFL